MKSLLRITILVLLSTALSFSIGDKPKEFDPADFSTPEAVAGEAKTYFKAEGLGKIRDQGYRKVAIVEFSVEYITAQTKDVTGSSVGLLDIAKWGGMGKKKFELDENFKNSLPLVLHDALVAELTNAGFTITPKEEVIANPAYQKVKGEEEMDKKRSGGQYKKEKMEVYPVEGLLTFKTGAFSQTGNIKAEAELMEGLGVDITLRVHIRVGLWKNGRPTLEDLTCFNVSAGVNKYKTVDKTGTVTCKKALYWNEDVVGDKEFKAFKGKVFTINSEKFQNAIMKMYPTFCQMAITMFD